MKFNIDIVLHRMPCEMAAFDSQNNLGAHEVTTIGLKGIESAKGNIRGNFKRIQLSKEGDFLEEYQLPEAVG